MPILCQPAAVPGELTAAIGGEVRVAASIAEAERMLATDPNEVLVVVGPAIATDEAFAFASTLRMRCPAAGVVLVREHVDVAVLTNALRAGVREVVPAGSVTELGEACERSRALSRTVVSSATPAEPARRGEILTVFSAKGGTGKTTIAINLACALEKEGKSVCVVDLDLAFGDVAINLQLDPARTILGGVAMTGRLDKTGANSLLTPYRQGMSVLLAPVAPGDAEKVSPALVTEVLDVLTTMVDYVVVDTPSQLSEHVLNAMDVSQHHVLVTTPDVPALKNLRLTMDMLDLLSYPREARSVVLNRSDSKVGLTTDDVERVIHGPITAHVPSTRDVPVSINKGTPITIATPNHPVSQAMVRFARGRIVSGSASAARSSSSAKSVKPAAKQGGFSLLRRGRR